jgi:hypothetical protein
MTADRLLSAASSYHRARTPIGGGTPPAIGRPPPRHEPRATINEVEPSSRLGARHGFRRGLEHGWLLLAPDRTRCRHDARLARSFWCGSHRACRLRNGAWQALAQRKGDGLARLALCHRVGLRKPAEPQYGGTPSLRQVLSGRPASRSEVGEGQKTEQFERKAIDYEELARKAVERHGRRQ